jgi:hypothetical protein
MKRPIVGLLSAGDRKTDGTPTASGDEFAYFEDFPIFARKRPAFFAFLQVEVKKWKAGS